MEGDYNKYEVPGGAEPLLFTVEEIKKIKTWYYCSVKIFVSILQ
jgi:hypothetical protein